MTAVEILARRVEDLKQQKDAAERRREDAYDAYWIARREAKRLSQAFTAAYSELELARSTAKGKP